VGQHPDALHREHDGRSALCQLFLPPAELRDPNPSLGWPTAALVTLLASVAPMLWTDLSCLWHRESAERQSKLGLLAIDALGLLASALVFLSLFSLKFRWDDNAYGSVVWW
jgi:cytochrome c oxidase subunit III